MGSSANISIALGKRRRDLAEKFLANSAVIVVLVAIVMNILLAFFARDLLLGYGATERNIDYAYNYLRIFMVGTIWNGLTFVLNSAVRAQGNSIDSMITSLVGTIINLVLDPIFIFGFNLGVKGAALATIIAQFCGLLYCFSIYFRGKSSVQIHWMMPSFGIVKKIFSIGITPFFSNASGAFVSIFIISLIRKYGLEYHNLGLDGAELAQSAHSIIKAIVMLMMMPAFAMNQALQPIIGFNFGAKNHKRVMQAFGVAFAWVTFYLTLMWIISTFFSNYPVSIMAKEGLLKEISATGLFYEMLFIPLYGILIATSSYFTAVGKAKKAFFLTILRGVVFLLPFLYFFPATYGLKGIWMAIGFADLPCFFVALAFVFFEYRQMIRLREVEENH